MKCLPDCRPTYPWHRLKRMINFFLFCSIIFFAAWPRTSFFVWARTWWYRYNGISQIFWSGSYNTHMPKIDNQNTCKEMTNIK